MDFLYILFIGIIVLVIAFILFRQNKKAQLANKKRYPLLKANSEYSKHNYQKAAGLYLEIFKSESNYNIKRVMLASVITCYLKSNDCESALQCNQFIKSDSLLYDEYLYNNCLIYYTQSDTENCKNNAELLIKQSGSGRNADGYFYLALVCEREGDFSEAGKNFEASAELLAKTGFKTDRLIMAFIAYENLYDIKLIDGFLLNRARILKKSKNKLNYLNFRRRVLSSKTELMAKEGINISNYLSSLRDIKDESVADAYFVYLNGAENNRSYKSYMLINAEKADIQINLQNAGKSGCFKITVHSKAHSESDGIIGKEHYSFEYSGADAEEKIYIKSSGVKEDFFEIELIKSKDHLMYFDPRFTKKMRENNLVFSENATVVYACTEIINKNTDFLFGYPCFLYSGDIAAAHCGCCEHCGKFDIEKYDKCLLCLRIFGSVYSFNISRADFDNNNYEDMILYKES